MMEEFFTKLIQFGAQIEESCRELRFVTILLHYITLIPNILRKTILFLNK